MYETFNTPFYLQRGIEAVSYTHLDVYKRQYWRTAFLFAQKTYRKQCSGYVYDAGYAALLYAGYVRKAWTAP